MSIDSYRFPLPSSLYSIAPQDVCMRWLPRASLSLASLRSRRYCGYVSVVPRTMNARAMRLVDAIMPCFLAALPSLMTVQATRGRSGGREKCGPLAIASAAMRSHSAAAKTRS